MMQGQSKDHGLESDSRQQLHQEKELLGWISSHSGISLHSHQMQLLRDCVLEACERFSCPNSGHFLERLRTSGPDSPEHRFLMKHITVGETYFFRIPEQISFLRHHWIPQVIARKRAQGNLCLRIWSAGCSGGEELYTVALLLRESLPDIHDWTIHLVGTDINIDALTRAREGLYSKWSLRTLEPDTIAMNFRRQGNLFKLHDHIRNMAEFQLYNLARDTYPSLNKGLCAIDLILCRNVFIYFKPRVIEHVMAGFADTLSPNGCLMLAPADLISQRYPALRLVSRHGVLYFERDDSIQADWKPLEEGKVQQPRLTLPPAAIVEKPAAVQLPPAPSPTPSVEPITIDYGGVVELLRNHQWKEAVEVAGALRARFPEDGQAYYWYSCTLSSIGDTAGALESSEQGLAADAMNASLHHLHATLLLDQNDYSAAEAGFRRALYLDWDRPDTHFQLAMLKERINDRKAVLTHLNDALKVVQSKPPEAAMDILSGMTFARMAEILKEEILTRISNS